jgi:hypothetical protein
MNSEDPADATEAKVVPTVMLSTLPGVALYVCAAVEDDLDELPDEAE